MTTASPTATALASPDTAKRQHAALIAAERLLADTAEAINLGTPAADLLACLTKYRAHLSELAAATRATVGGPAVSAGPR